ncbi:3-hexulose-6-phosphate synthase [Mobilisporobacter senegalensis]|uniref:3-hexulose-6-phosphate synthase n=1 Tax=Mobilisporobacter senegalensis TaxID=1329262 RepID=A0A3N1XNM9_9FIRM|nr:orotidine 5'-phosphate decarboxylase / HUMPS family protein [Mobilisporobacter senegalensis]ROR28256.1 3-hexulose-6-phosphate synthase [Mobilisporobacter senegalensis]
MILQLAIDRVTIEEAIDIIKETREYVDIIEIGTSLIKDYGMDSVRKIKENFPDIRILADIKTIDEAEYEFRAVYEAGADIATVMGASAISSIEICDRVAKEYKKDYMIDLLEVDDQRLSSLIKFKDAIFGVHLPADKNGIGLENLIQESILSLKGIERISVAGGVSVNTMPLLEKSGIEIAIVGGAITKAQDRKLAAKDFSRMKEVRK